MKTVLIKEFGDASGLYMGESPDPAIQPGCVRIAVDASGVNRADIVQRRGMYPPPPGESDILGLEVSGHIAELGAGVCGFTQGQPVMALLASGGYAEQVVVTADQVIPIPENISVTDAAGVVEVFVTAHHNLFTLGEALGAEKVLVHAGASGVGTAAIQLLCRASKEVFVTVGSQAKADFCRELGAEPILYKEESFAERAKGVDLVLDCIGASYLEPNIEALAPDGRLILIGLMGGRESSINLGKILMKRIGIKGSTLRGLSPERKAAAVSGFWSYSQEGFVSGQLKPIIDKVFAADEVQQAHQYMEQSQNIGKILLKW